MKIITLLEMEIECVRAMIIWLFLISSSQSIQISDNFFPYVTTTTDAESDFDGKCLSCRNKNQFTTDLLSSQENLYADYEDETADKTTTKHLMETSTDVIPGKLYDTRNPNSSLDRDNLVDAESDKYDISSDDSISTVQFENGDLSASLRGSMKETSTNTDSMETNHRGEKSSTSTDGMWLGTRLSRKNKRLNNNEESTNSGMWFGPRLGRRDKKSDDSKQSGSMWFGPRLGRRDRRSGNMENAISADMWFGSRLGRTDKRSENGEGAISEGLWFGPRVGRRDKKSTNEETISTSMWFGPRLGRRDRRSENNLKSTGKLFGHKLGQRDRHSEKHEGAANTNIWFGSRFGKRSLKAENNEQITAKGMWFGPRLGKRSATRENNKQLKNEGMWFGPRLGKRSLNTENNAQVKAEGMWFGPGVGKRSAGTENIKQVTNEGMWFGPRLGRRDRRSYSEKSIQELWFETQLGRKEKSNKDAHEEMQKSSKNEITSTGIANKIGCKDKKLFTSTASKLWNYMSGKNNSQSSYDFSPRLGRDSSSDNFYSPRMVSRKTKGKYILFVPEHDQRNKNVRNSVLISNLLGGSDEQPDYVFTPRLGRELFENKQFSFAQNGRSTPKKPKVFRKYGFFTPRLGRYVNTN